MEKIPVAPNVLRASFTERILDHLTGLNFDKFAKNLDSAHITTRMGAVVTEHLTNRNLDVLGENALNAGIFERPEAAPWSAYMAIVDTITDSESERTTSTNSSLCLTNTLIRFDSNLGRDRFQYVAEGALAGIQVSTMPRIRSGGQRELIIHDMSYADLSTLGRIATALMRRQYLPVAGRNIRGFAQQTIETMTENGFRMYLPFELANRAIQQEEILGADSLLSSGNLTRIGRAMRQALTATQSELETAQNKGKRDELDDWLLQIQRRYGDRPHIEARTRFISDKSAAPVSRTPMGVAIKDQVEQRVHEFKKPYKERDWDKVMRDIWSLASGLGASEGVGALLRALSTIARASATSGKGMLVDRRELRKLEYKDNSNKPH